MIWIRSICPIAKSDFKESFLFTLPARLFLAHLSRCNLPNNSTVSCFAANFARLAYFVKTYHTTDLQCIIHILSIFTGDRVLHGTSRFNTLASMRFTGR